MVTLCLCGITQCNCDRRHDPEAVKKLQEYYRFRFNVFKMYPYAKLAALKLKEINTQLAALDKKKTRRSF